MGHSKVCSVILLLGDLGRSLTLSGPCFLLCDSGMGIMRLDELCQIEGSGGHGHWADLLSGAQVRGLGTACPLPQRWGLLGVGLHLGQSRSELAGLTLRDVGVLGTRLQPPTAESLSRGQGKRGRLRPQVSSPPPLGPRGLWLTCCQPSDLQVLVAQVVGAGAPALPTARRGRFSRKVMKSSLRVSCCLGPLRPRV